MIIDTSAIMSLLQEEPHAERAALEIRGEPSCRVSAGTLAELFVVIERQQTVDSRRRLDDFVMQRSAESVPVSETRAIMAREAFRCYGRGIDPRARLNVGDHFTHTNLTSALDRH